MNTPQAGMIGTGARMAPTPGTREVGRNAVKGALAFGALGPPLGLLLVCIPVLLQALMADGARALLQAPGFLVMLLPVAYFFGLLPAAACGLIAGLVRTLRPRWLAVLCTTLAGGTTSAALAAAIRDGDFEVVAPFSAIGACSALLLALLFTRKARDRAALPQPAP